MSEATTDGPQGLAATVQTLVRLAEAQQETNRILAAQMEELTAAARRSLPGSFSPAAGDSGEIPDSVDSRFLSSDPKCNKEETYKPEQGLMGHQSGGDQTACPLIWS